jgi:hypothetical protein
VVCCGTGTTCRAGFQHLCNVICCSASTGCRLNARQGSVQRTRQRSTLPGASGCTDTSCNFESGLTIAVAVTVQTEESTPYNSSAQICIRTAACAAASTCLGFRGSYVDHHGCAGKRQYCCLVYDALQVQLELPTFSYTTSTATAGTCGISRDRRRCSRCPNFPTYPCHLQGNCHKIGHRHAPVLLLFIQLARCNSR